MADKKKKGLFGRKKEQIEDLEAELAKAKKETEAAKKAIKSQMDKNVKDKIESNKDMKDAKKKIADLENKTKAKAIKNRGQLAGAHKARKEALREKMAAKPKTLATHKVAAGETLSHIALKYYKHATPAYWKFLLENNKEILEGDEKKVRTGMELVIPELPAELKD